MCYNQCTSVPSGLYRYERFPMLSFFLNKSVRIPIGLYRYECLPMSIIDFLIDKSTRISISALLYRLIWIDMPLIDNSVLLYRVVFTGMRFPMLLFYSIKCVRIPICFYRYALFHIDQTC